MVVMLHTVVATPFINQGTVLFTRAPRLLLERLVYY
jgi:hypothetical protein